MARRSAALGLADHAASVLRAQVADERLPPGWRELADGWKPR